MAEKEQIIETEETLYSLNKQLCKEETFLTKEELNEKINNIIIPYCKRTNNVYFTLLNRERYDFTVFCLCTDTDSRLIDDLIDCLNNRGHTISIDNTENSDACEIWININNEPYVYYFFAYDNGVIRTGE